MRTTMPMKSSSSFFRGIQKSRNSSCSHPASSINTISCLAAIQVIPAIHLTSVHILCSVIFGWKSVYGRQGGVCVYCLAEPVVCRNWTFAGGYLRESHILCRYYLKLTAAHHGAHNAHRMSCRIVISCTHIYKHPLHI